MSTSCSSCPPGPESELAILCSFICVCNIKAKEGKNGQNLRQSCVDQGLEWMREAGEGQNILPQVGYVMLNPPRPLMNDKLEDESLPEPVKNWWHRFNKAKKVLKKETGEDYTKGMLRIPDVVITHRPGQVPVQEHIKQVVEIKFPGDQWGKGQKYAYEKIAGDDEKGKPKLTELSPDRCGCGDQPTEQQPKAYPHPALAQAWSDERDRQDASAMEGVGLIVGGALMATVLVLDDLLPTGVTQADDALLPVAGGIVLRGSAKVAAAFSRARVAVPRLIPAY